MSGFLRLERFCAGRESKKNRHVSLFDPVNGYRLRVLSKEKGTICEYENYEIDAFENALCSCLLILGVKVAVKAFHNLHPSCLEPRIFCDRSCVR